MKLNVQLFWVYFVAVWSCGSAQVNLDIFELAAMSGLNEFNSFLSTAPPQPPPKSSQAEALAASPSASEHSPSKPAKQKPPVPTDLSARDPPKVVSAPSAPVRPPKPPAQISQPRQIPAESAPPPRSARPIPVQQTRTKPVPAASSPSEKMPGQSAQSEPPLVAAQRPVTASFLAESQRNSEPVSVPKASLPATATAPAPPLPPPPVQKTAGKVKSRLPAFKLQRTSKQGPAANRPHRQPIPSPLQGISRTASSAGSASSQVRQAGVNTGFSQPFFGVRPGAGFSGDQVYPAYPDMTLQAALFASSEAQREAMQGGGFIAVANGPTVTQDPFNVATTDPFNIATPDPGRGSEKESVIEACYRDWEYEGMKGPCHWATKYCACRTCPQSPISINSYEATYKVIDSLDLANYDEPASVLLMNNGDTVEIKFNVANPPTIRGGGLHGDYRAAKIHFHWGSDDVLGSEHVLNECRYPMEMQILHYSRYFSSWNQAVNMPGGIVALSFFFEITCFDNPALQTLIKYMPYATCPGDRNVIKDFIVRELLPETFVNFYTYQGSLTTPPCHRNVTWYVFQKPVPISRRQLSYFRALKTGFHTENMYTPPGGPVGQTVLKHMIQKGAPDSWFHRTYLCGMGESFSSNVTQICLEKSPLHNNYRPLQNHLCNPTVYKNHQESPPSTMMAYIWQVIQGRCGRDWIKNTECDRMITPLEWTQSGVCC